MTKDRDLGVIGTPPFHGGACDDKGLCAPRPSQACRVRTCPQLTRQDADLPAGALYMPRRIPRSINWHNYLPSKFQHYRVNPHASIGWGDRASLFFGHRVLNGLYAHSPRLSH